MEKTLDTGVLDSGALAAFGIALRRQAREEAEDERTREAWARSEAEDERRRREGFREEWRLHHEHMRRLHARLAEEHRERAAALVGGRDES